MRLSLLDRSRTRVGETDAEAVRETVRRAVNAETLGYYRFWTAEHHAVPGIAGSAPTVLLAAIGAHTSTIRLGTGGVMLPNHAPLIVAEQALLLASLYPGRIDLGIGASLGFTAPVRRALGRTSLDEGEYAAAVGLLRDYLHGSADITPRPRVAPPPVFLLAVRNGLSLAAKLGLPVVIGGPLLADTAAVSAYLRDFQPSAECPEPSVIASVDVAIADTAEEARELLLPEAWAYATSREIGAFPPLRPIEQVRTLLRAERSTKKRAAVRDWYAQAITGTASQVTAALRDLTRRTGATEIIATTSTFNRAQLADADARLALVGRYGPQD